MLYPSVNELRSKVDSRYTLCMLAAKRARDLIDGAPVLMEDEEVPIRKVSIAADEIDEDLITYKSVQQIAEEQEQQEIQVEAGTSIFEEAEAEDAAEEPTFGKGEVLFDE